MLLMLDVNMEGCRMILFDGFERVSYAEIPPKESGGERFVHGERDIPIETACRACLPLSY